MGVNDKRQLEAAGRELFKRVTDKHLDNGVSFIDRNSAYIDADVKIGADTVVYPGVMLKGETEIGEGCVLKSGAVIINSHVGAGAIVGGSYIENSTIKNGEEIGPFMHIKNNEIIKR